MDFVAKLYTATIKYLQYFRNILLLYIHSKGTHGELSILRKRYENFTKIIVSRRYFVHWCC